MKQEHTPAPWKYGDLSCCILGPKGVLVASLDERSGDLNLAADARLIESAPEMLVLLRACATALNVIPNHSVHSLPDGMRKSYDIAHRLGKLLRHIDEEVA